LHELSVTQGILNIAVDAARKASLGRVTAIYLVVGDLSSIVDDSVQFYFDLLSQGTPAEGATLHFQRQPAAVVCLDCGHTYTARVPLAPACPACGGSRLRVTSGRELRVDSIEADERVEEDGRCED
jgi:hydrogenase nickel incorporation protein HypA/HybF